MLVSIFHSYPRKAFWFRITCHITCSASLQSGWDIHLWLGLCHVTCLGWWKVTRFVWGGGFHGAFMIGLVLGFCHLARKWARPSQPSVPEWEARRTYLNPTQSLTLSHCQFTDPWAKVNICCFYKPLRFGGCLFPVELALRNLTNIVTSKYNELYNSGSPWWNLKWKKKKNPPSIKSRHFWIFLKH